MYVIISLFYLLCVFDLDNFMEALQSAQMTEQSSGGQW